MICVHDLTEHIELKLDVRRVADADRRGFLVARQPVDDPFGKPPLAADAVHDLDLIGTAGHRPKQPFAPRLRFFVKAGIHRAEQRQRGVAQPAVAIVPIALAADFLRQRRGRRGDDAAGRPVGERFQRDHGTADRVRPFAGRAALCRPSGPEFFGRFQGRRGVEFLRQRLVRARIAQDKGNAFAAADGERADRGHVLACYMHRRAQHHHVRPGDRAQRTVFQPRHPRHYGAVAETQNEFGMHCHLAACADDEPHDLGMIVVERHEIDQRGGALVGLETGFKDERARPITAGDARRLARRHQPAAVVGGAEQRGKTRSRIKARPAQPVDRAVARNKRGAFAIADHGVIFDAN